MLEVWCTAEFCSCVSNALKGLLHKIKLEWTLVARREAKCSWHSASSSVRTLRLCMYTAVAVVSSLEPDQITGDCPWNLRRLLGRSSREVWDPQVLTDDAHKCIVLIWCHQTCTSIEMTIYIHFVWASCVGLQKWAAGCEFAYRSRQIVKALNKKDLLMDAQLPCLTSSFWGRGGCDWFVVWLGNILIICDRYCIGPWRYVLRACVTAICGFCPINRQIPTHRTQPWRR